MACDNILQENDLKEDRTATYCAKCLLPSPSYGYTRGIDYTVLPEVDALIETPTDTGG